MGQQRRREIPRTGQRRSGKESARNVVDGAQGGQAATDWTNSPHRTWSNVLQRLGNAGATTNQVQVIWMKQARRQSSASGAFPAHTQALQVDLENILRLACSQYPNLKIAFVSSRTRSYEDGPTLLIRIRGRILDQVDD